MPEHITLELLKGWRKNFLLTLEKKIIRKNMALLIDTNKHQFESIACLKLLRDLISNEVIHRLSSVAFVQPRKYRIPEIPSSTEGYFDNFEDAYSWLQQDQGTNSTPNTF